jgi:hypothetical protein
MTRTLPLVAGLVVLALTTVVHGLWTGRWQLSDEPAASARKLHNLSTTVGDWFAEETELDARQLAQAQVVGYVARRYTHRSTGSTVSILVLCGRHGPVAVHTPDVCYAGAGYEPVTPQEKYVLPAGGPLPLAQPVEFWTQKFRKQSVTEPEHLRIYWSWSAAGPWEAADNPRWTFAGRPALYKLYIIFSLPDGQEPAPGDPRLDFIPLLMADLHQALFATP